MPQTADSAVQPPLRRASVRAALWAGALGWLTAAFFINTNPGWNVNSQFDLACALAERGTFRIDAYHEAPGLETGDKAYFQGHYYCDKSPVPSLLAAPVVWLYRQANLQLGIPFSYSTARWLATVAVCGGSAALVAGLLVMLFCAEGAEPAAAARVGALWIAATPLMGYAVVFFNYLPVCAMLLAGYALLRPWLAGERRGAGRMLAAGVLVGLAAWTLNTVAVAALALTAALLAGQRRGGWRGAVGLWPWALGGLIGIAGYFIYNHAIFGTFTSAYRFEADPFFREQMSRGLMGAGWPRWQVALMVSVLPFQGLLLWFPLVTLATVGCVALVVRGAAGERRGAAAALAIFGALLVYVSGYFMWWGGWAYAPRHLLPALALLALGLAPWLRGPRWRRIAVYTVGCVGAVVNLSAIAVSPQAPPGVPQEALMALTGWSQWHPPILTMLENYWLRGVMDMNVGRYLLGPLGLGARWSLLPLGVLWIAAWWALPQWARAAERGGR